MAQDPLLFLWCRLDSLRDIEWHLGLTSMPSVRHQKKNVKKSTLMSWKFYETKTPWCICNVMMILRLDGDVSWYSFFYVLLAMRSFTSWTTQPPSICRLPWHLSTSPGQVWLLTKPKFPAVLNPSCSIGFQYHLSVFFAMRVLLATSTCWLIGQDPVICWLGNHSAALHICCWFVFLLSLHDFHDWQRFVLLAVEGGGLPVWV